MYHKEDIYQCHFDGTSGSTWDISPPNIERLNNEFMSDRNVRIYVTVHFTRFVIQFVAVIILFSHIVDIHMYGISVLSKCVFLQVG